MAETKKTTNKSTSSKTESHKKAATTSKQSSRTKSFGFFLGIIITAILAVGYLYFFQPTTFLAIQETAKSTLSAIQNQTENTSLSTQTIPSSQSANSAENSNTISSAQDAQSANENENQENNTKKRLSANELIPTTNENTSLFWGNPSNATTELENNTNYLIEKNQFAISYNSQTLNPNWVLWHLDADDLGDADRSDNFRPDNDLPIEWYKVAKNDYRFTVYGFDRGHVCPSADRTSTQEDNSATFLMTNMIPQSPDCNRILWKDLESFERNLVQQGKELYIAAGPYGTGGTSDKGYFESIQIPATKKFPAQNMTVPSYCWKIILIMDEGDNDFDRIFDTAEILAVFMPNAQDIQDKGSWDSYLTTVDFIEDKTGYDFLTFIPDEIENNIEKQIYQTSVEFID